MMMKQAVKFTFDTRFDTDETVSVPRVQPSAPVFTAEDIERARAEGYASGFVAGQSEATARAEHEIGAAMQNFANNAASLLNALHAGTASSRAEAATLAFTAARKLAPALVASRPQAEIEGVLRDCLTHLNREPHIVLRVADTLVERLKEIVDRMALERGLSGRIILLGQNDVAEGDCVVEWADGGVVRSHADIEAEISETIARYVESLGAPRADNSLAMSETRHTNF
ncbi:FliH/SctL family protein [Parvibaculum sp.]|uniref:FliH/SctL family protein n=1 Tax=Parvibaculum sp. TaxID=2024848 RepID=UPI00320D8FBB